SADGHFPQTINNVVVNNFQTTILNVELIPNPVPVELVSFTAEINGNNVLLKWQTATETNNQGFEIEKFQDYNISRLKNWKNIGFVGGNGTTTELTYYSFIDENTEAGFYQYRL